MCGGFCFVLVFCWGLGGFFWVTFFSRQFLEGSWFFEGKEHSITVAPVVGVYHAYISSAGYFKDYILHLWHRKSFFSVMYVCAVCALLAFTLYRCYCSYLRKAVPHGITRMCKNQLVRPNSLLSWILHNGVHLYQMDMKYRWCNDRFWSESDPCSLHAGWLGYGWVLVAQWKSGLPATLVVLGSAGGRWVSPVLVCLWSLQLLWNLVIRGTKGCPEAGGRPVVQCLLCHVGAL